MHEFEELEEHSLPCKGLGYGKKICRKAADLRCFGWPFVDAPEKNHSLSSLHLQDCELRDAMLAVRFLSLTVGACSRKTGRSKGSTFNTFG